MKSVFPFVVLFSSAVCAGPEQLRQQESVLENYETIGMATIVDTLRKDLLSDYPPANDAACILLLKTLDRLKVGDQKAQLIVTQLVIDKKIICAAADILDCRMPGWYNEATVDEIRLYTPLLYILAKADDKTSRGILTRSFLYLHNHGELLKDIPMSEEVLSISLKRLTVITAKLCCMYPGRDFVIAMLEKDSRISMLDATKVFLETHVNPGEKTKKEIREFTTDCLEYGDSKNGNILRTKAAGIAGLLIKNGETDLAGKIKDMAENDPYYVHKYDRKNGYSITELNYPVRDYCSKILSGQTRQ